MMELHDTYILINDQKVPLNSLIDIADCEQQKASEIITDRIRFFEMVVSCTEAVAEEPDPSIILYGLSSYRIPTPSLWDIESYIVGKTVYHQDIIIKHLPLYDSSTSL